MMGIHGARPHGRYRVLIVQNNASRTPDAKYHSPGNWLVDYQTDDEAPELEFSGTVWFVLGAGDIILRTNHPLWTPRIGHKLCFSYLT